MIPHACPAASRATLARRAIAGLLIAPAVAGCTGAAAPTPGPASMPGSGSAPGQGIVDLASPRLDGEVSLESALLHRRSVREFTAEPLSDEEVSQLLWAAQGLTSPQGGRTAPSAGALYPLEVYVVTAEGVYHYLPADHQVELHARGDRRASLQAAGLSQEAIGAAPAVFVIAAVFARTQAKYGERATRYVYLEAGHVAQNLLLQAVALDLGGVPIGAFTDAQVTLALDLPANHEPLYLIPIGHPR
jgi:SagB-type dehydrogenase family enzyme